MSKFRKNLMKKFTRIKFLFKKYAFRKDYKFMKHKSIIYFTLSHIWKIEYHLYKC